MTDNRPANRLIHATSPYLLQHAYNPVDWFEWSEEALSKAQKENKPILVSIGYSSCHWCHVMEREVFEKDNIARVMNEKMVCIKVDREERPDIDSIYMEAVQAMGVHGGWPLNVFLTPDQKPFYGGTYFPPDQWMQVINGIHSAYHNRRNEIEESAEQLTQALAQQDTSRFKKVSDKAELITDIEKIYQKLEPSFDKTWGGLDKAPKFIMPSVWLLLLRYHYITKNQKALDHTILTLRKIAMGGIYDQIGGGFARYSVDKYWFVPHFEKMLYDNAQLMTLYAEAFTITKDAEFKKVLDETFEWLQTEMTSQQGGFYSALDADSEGEEGKFYVWTAAELKQILKDDAALIIDYYSVKDEGNWEPDKNILMRVQKEESFLKKHQLTETQWQEKLQRCKDALMMIRDKRIRPGLDDKVITAWNAMMSIGLLDTFNATGDDRFKQSALKNLEFLQSNLSEGTTLYRSYKNKRSQTQGFLDDYAYVIQAYTKAYQVTFHEHWIGAANDLLSHTIEQFYDHSDGFFHYSSKGAEKLIAAKKELFDNVIPASNSVMAQNLLHLGILLDKNDWKKMAENMVSSLSHLITTEPNYMSNWGIVLSDMKKGMAEVAFVDDKSTHLLAEFRKDYQPFVLTMGTESTSQLPLMEGKIAVNGKATIYVCYNKTCQRPVHNVDEALLQII